MHEQDEPGGKGQSRPLRVVICDRHRVLREALGAYLSGRSGIGPVTLAATADEAVRLARAGTDVLVLDVVIAGESSSLDVLEAVRNLRLHVAVLMLGGTEDPDLISRALNLGAAGFCPKNVSGPELHKAVLAVAHGEVFLPDRLVAPVVAALSQRRRREMELMRLTPRERDVLRLLADGHRRDSIARRLGLSPNTVRTHVGSIMEKLEVHSQVAAAAVGRQLFDLQPATDDAITLRPVDTSEDGRS